MARHVSVQNEAAQEATAGKRPAKVGLAILPRGGLELRTMLVQLALLLGQRRNA